VAVVKLLLFPEKHRGDNSLWAATLVEEGEEVKGGAETGEGPVTALLKEFASMRLKILPNKGDLRDLNNWRGIMLLDAASKIISMVINGRLQRLLKKVGIEEQGGFMGGRGGSDGIFCIRQALKKKRREHGKESWLLFVDLVKAFGKVPRGVFFVVLAKFGVPPPPDSRRQARKHGPPGDLRSQRRAGGSALHRWRQAGVPAQPDPLSCSSRPTRARKGGAVASCPAPTGA
jgi:hypothetical protein